MKIGDKWTDPTTGRTMILTLDGPKIYDPSYADRAIAEARAFKRDNDKALRGAPAALTVRPTVKVSL